MSDGDAFLAAIIARPADDTVRLVYADWLDEHDQAARAEFIRVQIELARMPEFPPGAVSVRYKAIELRASVLRNREQELLGGNEESWLRGTPLEYGAVPLIRPDMIRLRAAMVWRRGFVEEVEFSWEGWLAHADAILAAHPVRKVTLTTTPGEGWGWNSPGGDATGKLFKASGGEWVQPWPGIEFESLSSPVWFRGVPFVTVPGLDADPTDPVYAPPSDPALREWIRARDRL